MRGIKAPDSPCQNPFLPMFNNMLFREVGGGGEDHAGGVAAQARLGGGHLLIGEQRRKVAQPRLG